MLPLISICIPAYKNVSFLKRLLDSIVIQSYKNYEVIISDDSPDDAVSDLINSYLVNFPSLNYWRNHPAKGMPENWNTAISKAKGDWIKIMHDDDWFLSKDALAKFVAKTDSAGDFIFSNYENNYMDAEDRIVKKTPMVFPKYRLNAIAQEPLLLLADNKIGPPSVCMVRSSVQVEYDSRLRWRVDIDYYKRVLMQNPKMILLEESLIGVGMNQGQITNQTKNRPEVELPESFLLLQKYGTASLGNWIVYDSWWRMMRNMHIHTYEQLRRYVPEDWPPAIIHLMNSLERTPSFLLKTGVTSKLCMLVSHAVNKSIEK